MLFGKHITNHQQVSAITLILSYFELVDVTNHGEKPEKQYFGISVIKHKSTKDFGEDDDSVSEGTAEVYSNIDKNQDLEINEDVNMDAQPA